MAVWSLLAWFGYMAADPLLVWLGSALGVVVESSQGVAEAFGGKPAGEVFGALNAGGAGAQILAVASLILKPAIVVIWALGMVALAVLPTLASVAGRLLGRR
ncbi:MAG: hypothetical protein INR68_16380 [Methylobacterium mesophilicum]|nr:hypothetical protein [Methylobacterium mesophilicum]